MFGYKHLSESTAHSTYSYPVQMSKSLGCFHTPVYLASQIPRVDDLSLSRLLADAVMSGTAAPAPPAAPPSTGGAQPPPHASLFPVGSKSIQGITLIKAWKNPLKTTFHIP